MQITSKKSEDWIQGINDGYAKQGLKAESIGKQIFKKYGYSPVQIMNSNDNFFPGREPEGTDNGMDNVIHIWDIPENDPLHIKLTKKARFSDCAYVIDYKSNNFSKDPNSIYVKLMKFYGIKTYLAHEINGKTVYPVEKFLKLDEEKWKRARENNKVNVNSFVEKFYRNTQLLGQKNVADYFFYLKYPLNEYDGEYGLSHAYLVPAEQLRYQVINILNNILKEGGYDYLIELRKNTLYLNSNIVRAYTMVKDNLEPKKSEIELFQPGRKRELILRIPEKLLTPHIKFDNEGAIVYNHHLN